LAEVVVVGMGYVGLTSALGLTKIGHRVMGVDVDLSRLSLLKEGKLPIYEPGLEHELTKSLDSKKFFLSDSIEEASNFSNIYFVCVPTPQNSSGAADLSFVVAAVEKIADHAQEGSIIIIKSTVPVGTGKMMSSRIRKPNLHLASNPEFLREGSALKDFMEPDRIVVGASNIEVSQRIMNLYEEIDTVKLSTSVESAELIKYAANAYLASRLSFVNDIAALCEKVGANIDQVMLGMGSDSRIGKSFLRPGPGWGGSCFPKDTRALLSIGESHQINLSVVAASIESNELAFDRVVGRVRDLLGGNISGKTIAAWGIAFKANTDDMRDSPSLEVIKRLLTFGCTVKAFDPVAKAPKLAGLQQVDDPISATREADALIVLTEWDTFKGIDPRQVSNAMTGSVVLDTRQVLSETKWKPEFDSFHVIGNGS